MDVPEKRIAQLITQYIKGTLPDVGKTELNQWLAQPGNQKLFEKITNKQSIIDKCIRYNAYDVDAAWKILHPKLSGQIIIKRKWISYAAAIFLPLAVLASVWLINQMGGEQQIAEHQILPAKNSATIYFSDGGIQSLNNDSVRIIVKPNMEIEKLEGKLIIHSKIPSDIKLIEPNRLNKIVTARGNEIEVLLPDGTYAWLNADSYLEFPSVFKANERRVKINGEVYFEVAKDSMKPFIVDAGPMALKVLGTQFNVRYYSEEKNIVSTLVEGKVEVRNPMDQRILLTPGQSASLNRETESIQVEKVDVGSVIAWKNGRFYFESQPLETIMQELSRWYDFEFSFEDDTMKGKRFSVDVPRFENCNKILSKIEGTKILAIDITPKGVVIKSQEH